MVTLLRTARGRTAASGTRGLGRPGRIALGLGGFHVLLLFLPPIPPDVKGSLWSYLLAGAAVALATVEVRSRAPAVVSWWTTRESGTRWGIVCGVAAGLIVSGLALRAASPELFHRWSDDEGVYQPATMLAYLCAALILLTVAHAHAEATADERLLTALAVVFGVLFLEEVDYFGLIGGIVGRVDGVYVGSLHDLIHVATRAGPSATAATLLVGASVFAALLIWRCGRSAPRRLASLASPSGTAWLVVGSGLMGAAQAMDTGTLGLGGDMASLEELLELTAAVLWLALALEIAVGAHAGDPGAVRPPRDENRSPV